MLARTLLVAAAAALGCQIVVERFTAAGVVVLAAALVVNRIKPAAALASDLPGVEVVLAHLVEMALVRLAEHLLAVALAAVAAHIT